MDFDKVWSLSRRKKLIKFCETYISDMNRYSTIWNQSQETVRQTGRLLYLLGVLQLLQRSAVTLPTVPQYTQPHATTVYLFTADDIHQAFHPFVYGCRPITSWVRKLIIRFSTAIGLNLYAEDRVVFSAFVVAAILTTVPASVAALSMAEFYRQPLLSN